MSKREFFIRKEIRNDVYNDWRSLLRYHEYVKFDYREIGVKLNYEFDVSLPVTKQHGIHEINGYLYRLRIYPIETKQGNINFTGYINEEGTKLYVYTKNTFKRGKYITHKHYVYHFYSFDISFLTAFQNNSYYQIDVIQKPCGYDYYFKMLPKFNNSYSLLRAQYELDCDLERTKECAEKKKQTIIERIFNIFK